MPLYGANSRENPLFPKIGIIGGSGIYELEEIEILEMKKVETKYGYSSEEISIGRYKNELVAFIPRHGKKHSIPPHKIPYKANISALKSIGVECILATCIAGSLKKEIAPGCFVLPDQFVNMTWGRDDYFESDNIFLHLPMAEPYCENLKELVYQVGQKQEIKIQKNATVVVIQGPRFSTIAESRFFVSNGWDLVNMTQYPECYFAREFGLCYCCVAAITDYDVGVSKKMIFNGRKQTEKIIEIFHENIMKTKALLYEIIVGFGNFHCKCAHNIVRNYFEDDHP